MKQPDIKRWKTGLSGFTHPIPERLTTRKSLNVKSSPSVPSSIVWLFPPFSIFWVYARSLTIKSFGLNILFLMLATYHGNLVIKKDLPARSLAIHRGAYKKTLEGTQSWQSQHSSHLPCEKCSVCTASLCWMWALTISLCCDPLCTSHTWGWSPTLD